MGKGGAGEPPACGTMLTCVLVAAPGRRSTTAQCARRPGRRSSWSWRQRTAKARLPTSAHGALGSRRVELRASRWRTTRCSTTSRAPRLMAQPRRRCEARLNSGTRHCSTCAMPTCALAWWQIALVRKSIPCIELKMLKHGGTVSKTHSVCIPNKVDVVTTFPRSAASCGIVRCGGSMHSPSPPCPPAHDDVWVPSHASMT